MFENFTSWSGGQSQNRQRSYSTSRSGINPMIGSQLLPLVSTVSGKASGLIGKLGSPDMDVYRFYTDTLMPTIQASYQRNVVPAIQSSLLSTINNLANRGILDSSVASRAIGSVMSEGAKNLANLFSDLQKEAVGIALSYPMKALGTLSPFLASLADAYKEAYSQSASEGEGSSVNFSYNPAPILSLLNLLL